MKTTVFRACLGFVFLFAAGSAASQSEPMQDSGTADELCLSDYCIGDPLSKHVDIEARQRNVNMPGRVSWHEAAEMDQVQACGSPTVDVVLEDEDYLETRLTFGVVENPGGWQGYQLVEINKEYFVRNLGELEKLVLSRFPAAVKSECKGRRGPTDCKADEVAELMDATVLYGRPVRGRGGDFVKLKSPQWERDSEPCPLEEKPLLSLD